MKIRTKAPNFNFRLWRENMMLTLRSIRIQFCHANNRDLKQTGRQRDDDGYSHNDIPVLVQKK